MTASAPRIDFADTAPMPWEATDRKTPLAWVAIASKRMREEVVQALQDRGWTVGFVTSHPAALIEHAKTQATSADLVIMGLRFDEGDGFALLRGLGRLAKPPAVAFMSWQQRSVIRAATALARACRVPLVGAHELPVSVDFVVDSAIEQITQAPQRPARAAGPDTLALTAAALRELLDRQAIVPYFQPKLRLDTQEVTGFETLMRATDVSGRLITPDRLIEPLLANGLLGEASLAMAKKTVAFVASCLRQGLSVTASINVSLSLMADAHFFRNLLRLVEQAGLDPTWITIEITETEAMADLATVIEQTGRIRMMGFNLSIDDFGTAYSSFFQLSQIPFSEIKIERAFVQDMQLDNIKRSIVGTCAYLGRSLGLSVVAEGVETDGEMRALVDSGCSTAQGYLIARPMPGAAAMDWLKQRHPG